MSVRLTPILVKIIIPLLLIGGGVVGMKYFVATKPVETPKEVVERSWNVAVIDAAPATITSAIRLYGELVSARRVDLRSLVGGEITEVSEDLKEGARVMAGSMLVAVDAFDYEALVREAEAAVLEAKSRSDELKASERSDRVSLKQDIEIYELEQRNLARSETLKKRGNISDKALDDAKTAVSRQQQQVDQRRAQLDVQKARIGQQIAVTARLQVALERANRDLENVRLIAPFSGYLQNVSVELGKKIDAKELVANLIDDQRIEVKFHVSNAQYGALLASEDGIIGKSVSVLWQAGNADFEFDGTIARIGSTIQSETGGIEIYARLEPSASLSKIRIGAFVEVALKGAAYENAIRLPDYALYEGHTVYKVVVGRLQPVEAAILLNEGNSLIVDATALKAGDKILITRFAEAGPGLKVEIR